MAKKIKKINPIRDILSNGVNPKIGYIKPREITQEMKESYIDYAMSVIISRALPDVRDGLKPVQRRILYTMLEDGLRHDAKFRKSASVIGSVLSRYHPHGDMAVYNAVVRMAQDFSLRYPLIQGQGNFGCFTRDTKVRLCDGRNLSFEDLIKEQKTGKRHWTFTFNPEAKKIEITEIKNSRLTGKKRKIIEVTLDNGEKIKCTLDHQFMLREGSYRQARDLKPGDLLMPLYTKLYEGKDDLIKKYQKVTPNLDEKESTNNDLPRIENALNYFGSFSEILAKSQKHNHKVIKTRILKKREDVYDLTAKPWQNFALAAGIFVHNSIDGDSAAAYRYTEARLSRIGEEMLNDIEKNTVDFVPNFDGTRKEPVVLPSPLPNLLLNGCMGIAVGMATNIPPHNLSEVCDAIIYLFDYPRASAQDIFKFILGPDFPTGGIIYDQKSIIAAYSQGKGPILIRGKAEILEGKKGPKIIISEIPFGIQKSDLLQQIAKLVQEKKLGGIKDIRDESDREGLRIVIDLKRISQPQRILNSLYKWTSLQTTFHLNILALVDGIQPKVLSLPEILRQFISHRQEIILRRTKFDLEKAKERAHILEGFQKALAKIDSVIKTIKASKDKEEAQKNLIKKFDLTKPQTDAILEMKLSALAKLEREKVMAELKEKINLIKALSLILKSPKKIKELLRKELAEYKENFGDERKTKVILGKIEEISPKDLIPKEPAIITLTQNGFIKRLRPSILRVQKRGGKGVLGQKTTEGDFVSHLIWTCTHDDLFFFTDSGKVFKTKVFEIPEEERMARGKNLLNFLEVSAEEKILDLISLAKEEIAGYFVMGTKNGIIKKTKISEYENVRRTGLIAISLKKGDLLRKVSKSSGEDEIILVTKKGKCIRFKEKDLRSMGRGAAGTRGIKLAKMDEVIGMGIIENKKLKIKNKKRKRECLLVVMENGYGKRTEISDYRVQKRGGRGIKTAKATEKTGDLVASKILKGAEKYLILISQKGKVLKVKLSSIPKTGRATQGVRIMKLEEEDKVASITCI